MSLISFERPKYISYFLVYWALEILVAVFNNINKNYLKFELNDLGNEYINLICLNIADLLAGFLVIYTICSISKKVIKKKESKNEIQLIYNDPNNRKFKTKLLILISILDLLSRSVYFLFFLTGIAEKHIIDILQMDWVIAIDILSRYFFSRIILKTKLYKHHFWSILISVVGFIFMSLIDLITIFSESEYELSKKYGGYYLFYQEHYYTH